MPRTHPRAARTAAVAAVALAVAAGWAWRRADRAVAPGADVASGPADRAAAPAAPTVPPPWAAATIAVVVRDGDGMAVTLLDGGAPAGRPAPRRLVGGFEAIGGLAFAPDGQRLAFAARRDGRWDLFAVDRDGQGLTRLTDDAAYDADPAWSPDGRALAYSAVADGRLAVFRVAVPAAGDAGGMGAAAVDGAASPVRLTDGDGPAIEPSWSPDGSRIAFAAWHDGAYRIEAVAPDGGASRVVAPATAADDGASDGAGGDGAGGDGAAASSDGDRPPEDLRAPRWSPDGGAIAYLAGRHGALRLDVQPLADGVPHGPSTTLAPAAAGFGWLDATTVVHLTSGRGGRAVGARSRSRFGRADLAELPGDPLPLGAGATALAVAAAVPGDALLAALPAAPAAASSGARAAGAEDGDRPGLVNVPGVRVSGPRIHAGLADDFGALRSEVAAATGADFLGTLSDMWRPVAFHSSASAYFSWHKTGRAFDTQMELRGPGGRRDMVLVREDSGGGGPQWRMVLRAAAQDGSVGQPLTVPGWTFSAGGGDDRHAADGGHRAASVPGGYWVDFTALAARYGWRRINANARPGFDWRTHWAAIEYWHYERRDGLRWFEAARQVYSDDDLAAAFAPDRLRALAIPLSRLSRQGFPSGWHADG